jgi:hypothetical protein
MDRGIWRRRIFEAIKIIENDERLSPHCPDSRQPHFEYEILSLDSRTLLGSLQDGELSP